MNKIISFCVALAAAAGFGTAVAAPAPPAAVKPVHATEHNRLFQRPSSPVHTTAYKSIMKAPQAKYINVSKAEAGTKIPAIIGGLLDSYSGLTYGLYQLPDHEGGEFTFIRNGIYPNGGGVAADGYYHSCEVEEGTEGVDIIIRTYDMDTWRNTRSFSPSDYSFIATDVAHDPITGQIYGCLWDTSGSGYMFGTIDYVNGTTHKIKALDNLWNAVAIDRDGTIYAIEQVMEDHGAYVECVKSSLYKVDRTSGSMTLVGDTGLLPYYASSAVIDQHTGRMFWSVTPKDDSQSALYEVDKATGHCTLVYSYPGAEQFMGMYVPTPLAEDDAPAAATNLSTTFAEGKLTGTVNFIVPTLTYSGAQGSGDISYEIYTGSVRLASGATQWGKAEKVAVTLPAGGQTEITVTLLNATGASPKEKVSVFAGSDAPTAPAPTAAWADGTMTLTWDVPAGSVNGGYVDPAALTYKVTRYPGPTVVAEATTATSFTEAVEMPDKVVTYFYAVEATYNGKTSAPGYSNRVVLGASTTPYILDFAELDDLDDLTVINENPDSQEWELSGGAALLAEDRVMPKDDWLITAPVRLVPGAVYAVTVKASSQGSWYPEQLEVKYGEGNTPEAMTETVIPVTDIATSTSSAYKTLSGYISVQKETTVFVGVHACSPADVWNLRVSYIAIEAAFASTAPGAATNFKATPDATGANAVTVTMNAPTIDYDGNKLSQITRLAIFRDGTEIHSVEAPAPGEEISYTDKAVTIGEHTYSAIAYSGTNPGREISQTVFVGVAIPAAPEFVSAVETETEGEVTLTWAEVTTDANGYPISSDLVSYTVYQPNELATAWVPVASGIKGNTYTFMASPDTQVFDMYAVAAVTSAGTSNACPSDAIPVGPSFKVPFFESFANGLMQTLFTAEGAGADWEVAINDPQYLAQADDNGFVQMIGEYYGSNGVLLSGKINLEGSVNPTLSFATFNYFTTETGPDYNSIDVYACPAGGEWTLLKQFIVKDMADQNRWGTVNLPLEQFNGKKIQLMFKVTHYSYDRTTIDQISIANGVDHNLGITSFSAPAMVAANAPFKVEATVENAGLNDAADFTVKLYRDGEVCDTRTLEALRAGRTATVAFEQVFTPLVEDEVEYYAELVYGPDMIADDNKSASITVTPEANNLPVVPYLYGELESGHAVLNWDEPDTDTSAPDPVNETFETAESFATTGQDGWIFVDVDKAPTQSAEYVLGVIDPDDHSKYITMPGIGDGSPLAWAVVDHTQSFGRVSWFEPHAGSKLLIALAADGKANDDWAISPELYGGEQTISFWAKGKEDDSIWGVEKFEVLYSTGSTEPADFVKVNSFSVCSKDWQPFSFNVPEGARRFAVRYVSEDTYSFMIDDFTFVPEGATADISLLGYNLYRDSKLVNKAAIEDNTFTDTEAEDGDHSYVVTALYDKGESRASNAVSLTTSGVEAVGAAPVITVSGLTIAVSADADAQLALTALDGKVLARTTGTLHFTVAAPGVYLVTVNGKTAKVAVTK